MEPECYTTPEEFLKNADREFTVRDLVDCTKIKPESAAGMLSNLVIKGKLNVKRIGYTNVYSKSEFPKKLISAKEFLTHAHGVFTTNDFANATGIVDSLGALKQYAKRGIVTWYKSGNKNYWTVIADINEIKKQKPGRKPNMVTERKKLAEKFFKKKNQQLFTAKEFAEELDIPITSAHPYLNKYLANGILECYKTDSYWIVDINFDDLKNQKPSKQKFLTKEAFEFFSKKNNKTFTTEEFASELNLPLDLAITNLNKFRTNTALGLQRVNKLIEYKVVHKTTELTKAEA